MNTNTRFLRIAAALWLLAPTVASALPAASPSPDSQFRKAGGAYSDGDFAEAAYALRELANERHFSGGALHNLGNAEWKVGRAGYAVLAWERARSLNPFSRNTEANLRFARHSARVEAPTLSWHERYSTLLPGDWWLVIANDSVDLCDFDPGDPVAATMETDLRTLTQIWRGDLSWQKALHSGGLLLHGSPQARRVVPRWLKLSAFAKVPRPA